MIDSRRTRRKLKGRRGKEDVEKKMGRMKIESELRVEQKKKQRKAKVTE